jgi:predicted ester cyclase
MTRCLIGVMLVGALALGGACGKKDDDKPKDDPEPAAKSTDKRTRRQPKLLTPEQRAKIFQVCWGDFNSKNEAKFAPCYSETTDVQLVDSGQPALTTREEVVKKLAAGYWAGFPDGVGTPQLTLVSDNRILSVDLYRGTHTGEFMGVPATGKKVGYYIFHDFTGNEVGSVDRGRTYVDMATVMGQLGVSPAPHRAAIEAPDEPIVVIANNDATEQANIALAKKSWEQFNAKEIDAMLSGYAEGAVFRDVTLPEDIIGPENLEKAAEGYFKTFPDIKGEVVESVAAGDYVVTFGRLTGTNTGAAPEGLNKPTGKSIELHVAEILKFENGKITEQWFFSNGMAMAIQLGLMPDPAAAAPEGGDAPPAKK